MFKIFFTVFLMIQAIVSGYFIMAYRFKKVSMWIYITAFLGFFFSIFYVVIVWSLDVKSKSLYYCSKCFD